LPSDFSDGFFYPDFSFLLRNKNFSRGKNMTKGFFKEKEPRKLIICGDILDRGKEARKVVEFILDLAKKDEVIIIKGNHEDLMEAMLDDLVCGDISDYESGQSIHVRNGTGQPVPFLF
jgi:metallophosphoesterase superfamily enzyme